MPIDFHFSGSVDPTVWADISSERSGFYRDYREQVLYRVTGIGRILGATYHGRL